jgi:AraC-like DNA-binding protein
MNNSRLKHIQNWSELARQANWSAVTLAEQCHVSMSTLKRYFLKHMGKTPKVWLTEQRQYRAVKIIQSGIPVKQAAAQLAYDHPNQFSREFHKFWGYCPTSPIPVHRYFGGQMT